MRVEVVNLLILCRMQKQITWKPPKLIYKICYAKQLYCQYFSIYYPEIMLTEKYL